MIWTPKRSLVLPFRQRGWIPLLAAGFEMPLIVVDGADFDGTDDRMNRTSALSGVTDSKSGIFSAWYSTEGGAPAITSQAFLMMGADPALRGFSLSSFSDSFRAILTNAAGSGVLDIRSSGFPGATWNNILASWDLAVAGSGRIYANDVSSYVETSYVDDTIDYTWADWWVGSQGAAVALHNGPLAEIYFAPGQYLDFNIVANRRKFISSSKKPVFLGTTGEKPTGTAPALYLHLADGEAVANFATDRSGNGNNFTIAGGGLATGASSPSD